MTSHPNHLQDSGAGKLKMRHCFFCGAELGCYADAHYDRLDHCGKPECNREASYQIEAERQEAHDQLDRNNGWE